MEQISFILNYLQDKLEVVERQRFENRLKEDPAFAEQVAALRQDWNYQRLNDWLAGKLSPPEAQTLTNELSINPELQQQLEEVKNVNQVLSAVQQNRILKDVKEIAARQQVANSTQTNNRRNWIIAFILLLFTALAIYFFYQSNKKTSPIIAQQYFKSYPTKGNLLQFDETEPASKVYKNGMLLYDQEEYEKSILIFNQIPTDSPFYHLAQFYTANAYLAQGQALPAIDILSRQLSQAKNASSKVRLQWYLSLSYLYAQKEIKAIELLDLVAKQEIDLFYQQQARKLRADLDAL